MVVIDFKSEAIYAKIILGTRKNEKDIWVGYKSYNMSFFVKWQKKKPDIRAGLDNIKFSII